MRLGADHHDRGSGSRATTGARWCGNWTTGGTLAQSVQGPWCPDPGMRSWETYFLPVIVHTATDVPRNSRGLLATKQPPLYTAASNPMGLALPKLEGEWKAAQNICLLPFQYGSCLNRELASRDSLYALSELFQIAASAEVQFLNLLHKHIEHELSFVGDEDDISYHSISLLNLKYIKLQLNDARAAPGGDDRHPPEPPLARLAARRRLRARREDGGPAPRRLRVPAATGGDPGARVRAGHDHAGQQLGAGGVAALRRHDHDRAAAHHHRYHLHPPLLRLLRLGHELRRAGLGTQPMWMWGVTAAPVVGLSYLLYRWDFIVKLYHYIIPSRRDGQ